MWSLGPSSLIGSKICFAEKKFIKGKGSYKKIKEFKEVYINHLINSNEILASMILTMNNLSLIHI